MRSALAALNGAWIVTSPSALRSIIIIALVGAPPSQEAWRDGGPTKMIKNKQTGGHHCGPQTRRKEEHQCGPGEKMRKHRCGPQQQ